MRRNQKNSFGVIEPILKKFGFQPIEKESQKTENGKKVFTTETIIGFYKGENNYTGFIHYTTNKEILSDYFTTRLKTLTKADAIYEGEKYVLIKKGDNYFPFSNKLISNIKGAIASINTKFPFRIKEYQIIKSGELLGILMDDTSLFIIARIMGYDEYVEEERIILTNKVDAARLFFNLNPYQKVFWSNLKSPKGKYFEALCEIIISKQTNIIEIQPIGKTNASDRGRDFIVRERTKDIDGKTREVKWLVQCKFSENSISPKTVPDWTNRVIEHKVDGYSLITNNDIIPDLFDQLNDAKLTTKINIETKIWQRNKFDTLFNTHPDLFTKDNFE